MYPQADSRQRTHSSYGRFSVVWKISVDAAEQALLVTTTSRQPRCRAITSTAGNQAAACESPNSTTVVDEARSPYAQGLRIVASVSSVEQWSRYNTGWS